MEILTKIKLAIVLCMTALSEQFGMFGVLAFVLCCLMIIDWISGALAAISENAKVRTNDEQMKHGLKSILGIKGIVKKIGYMCAVVLACVLDATISITTDYLGIVLPVTLFFGNLVCLWFVCNEMVSILENLDRSGVALPSWLIKTIDILKINIDKKANEMVDKLPGATEAE